MRRTLVPLLALFAALSASPAAGQALQRSFWIPDGPVYAMAWSPLEQRLYVGGAFDRVGPPTGAAARVDASTGAVQTPYIGAFTSGAYYASVNAIESDGAGGWFLGGYFTSIGGYAQSHLAHLFSTGQFDFTWTPVVDGPVNALHRSGTTLYVGGDFTTLGGQPRGGIGAVSTTDGSVMSWNPNASGGATHFIGEFSGLLYVGGAFTSIGGAARNRAAALSLTTAAATSWNPNVNNTVRAIERAGSYVALGGDFGQVGGQAHFYSALVNTTTGAPLAAFDANGPVRAFESDGTLLWVGGDFTTLGGQPRNRLAAITVATGALSATWTPSIDGPVHAIALDGGSLLVGGGFITVAAQDRAHVAAFNASTAALQAWAPQASNVVHAIGAGSPVMLGGEFLTANCVRRKNLAAFSLSPLTYGQVDAWTHDVPGGAVRALRIQYPYEDLYVGGDFTDGDPNTPDYLAKVSTATGATEVWVPAPDGPVADLDLWVTQVCAAGSFASFPGPVDSPDFVGLDQGSAALVAGFASSQHTTDVRRVRLGNWYAPSSPRLYLAGDFTSVRGVPRRGLAAWGVGTGAVEPWDPFPLDSIDTGVTLNALHVDGVNGTVTAGGYFTPFGTTLRRNLLAFDPQTGAALPWAPNPDGSVHAMASYGDRLYVAGSFGTIAGHGVNALAAFLTSGNRAWIPWVPVISDLYSLPGFGVYDVEPVGITEGAPRIAVGGVFGTVNGFFRPYLAVLDDTAQTPADVPRTSPPSVSLAFGPNPVRTRGSFRFSLAGAGAVTLALYDLQGREVARLLDHAWREPGEHRETLGAVSLAPGVYAARITSPEGTATVRIVRLD